MALTYQLGCLLVCLQCFWGPTGGGKLLVIPTDGSHWLSMQILLKELNGRGHKITVVYPEINLLINPSSKYSSKTFSIAFSKAEVNELYESLTEMGFYSGTFYQRVHKTLQHVNKISQFFHSICEHLLFNTALMKELAEEKYDALLTDPFVPCGTIIAENLSLPTVNLLRGLPCGLDNFATQCPRPLSYVPRILSGYTDRMTFLQRTRNVLFSFLEPLLCWFIYSPFEELAQRFLQRDVTLVQLLSQTSIWLLRYDFTLEYPRPLMPNMVLVGGINCKDRKPLPQADNAERIKDRGAGIVLSLKDTSSRDLRDALSLVINDSRYKEAIMKMSSIYKDRSMESLELSAYWVEYVMRHGGAKHLRTAAHDYNWIQYHCLDVMAALVAMVLLLLFLVIKCCSFCRRRVRGQAKRKKD